MPTDTHTSRIAKGVRQCVATPEGHTERHRLWLTSGSPLTKNIVQLLIWEWVSLWLMLLMLISVLLFNGFFTNELGIDSYPRLAVTLIYTVSTLIHFLYVWNACSRFFT